MKSLEKSTMKSQAITDLRNRGGHPLSLLYSEIYSAAVLTGRLQHGRSQPGFSLKGASPFYLSALAGFRHGLEKPDVFDVIRDVLRVYYEKVVPEHAAEWLGMQVAESHVFRQNPPWAAVFPWRARSIESYRQAYEKAAIEENRSVGIMDRDIQDGWLFCGPVSEAKMDVEARRIGNVLKSIKDQSYCRSDESDGDARATALVKSNGEWRWLLTAGNHRAAAASALGYDSIPIRVNLVIDREHVDFWPHVRNGNYTREQALEFFDRVFEAESPPITKSWNQFVLRELAAVAVCD
ncbi:hypothetical protein QA596_04450 [Balneolales bacterium ANBcel1]|nr:hypothetical protein [Balneolales bacterium ANBcel1]